MRKMKAAIVVEPSSSPYPLRSILSTSCRAIPLLTSVRFVHRSDRNAATPTTLESAHWTSPPVASSSRSMKETTSGQAAAPSTPPRGPLQKPSKIQANRALTREIDVIFPSSGRPPPLMIPSAPLDGRLGLATSSRSFLPPPPSTSITVASPRFFRRINPLAVKPSPLAPLLLSTPAISGDETTFDGFARKSSTFPLLVATAEEPPFAADADGKLACATSILRLLLLLLLLLLPFLHRANDRYS